MWESYKKGFKAYLQLEKSLSNHSVNAYLHDVTLLTNFLETTSQPLSPQQISLPILQQFVMQIASHNISVSSQARILSGIRHFFKYCLMEQIIEEDPSTLLEMPKAVRHLPDVLSFEEIEKMIAVIDVSVANGVRNKAILETLYSCGLRVSELTSLQLSNLYLEAGFIRIIGKGNKERLTPIGRQAIHYLQLYLQQVRNKIMPCHGFEDIVFLNRFGKSLSRIMIFQIIKELSKKAGIQKTVSPHTFRHSFATHLIQGGANLRAVQEMLGHESITTTEIYTHITRDFLRNTLEQYHPAFKK